MRRTLIIFLFIVLTLTCLPLEAAKKTVATGKEVVLNTVNFYKADLVAVLQQLAADCGYNVIITPEVKGTVTIQLTKVTFEQVLKFIVDSQGLTYQQKGRNIFIGYPGQLPGDKKTIGYFHLYYAEPAQVVEILKKLVGNVEILADDRTRTIIVNCSSELMEKISEIIKSLDIKLPQITIEVKVVEVSVSALRKLGMEWEVDDSSINWGITSSGAELILNMISHGHSWSAIFKALSSQGKARLVTSPSVSTLDGKEATILIGNKVPVETKDSSGNTVVNYLEVGVKLSFTPRVQHGDEIAIDIKTQVNSLGEKVNNYYIIGAREVTSRIQAKNGETVFLGGLISQEERDSLMKVPVLGDLFLIGKLFQFNDRNKEQTELIISITPKWNDSVNLIK